MDRNKERTSNLTKLILVVGVIALVSPCLLLINAFATHGLQPLSEIQLDLIPKSDLGYKELECVKGGCAYCGGYITDCKNVSCASLIGQQFTCSPATAGTPCFTCGGGNTWHCVQQYSYLACLDLACIPGPLIPGGCGDKEKGECTEVTLGYWGCGNKSNDGSCGSSEGRCSN